MELSREEIRVIFLFKFKLGHSATQTATELHEAFGESCASLKTIERWFQKFRAGDFSLKDADRPGRPMMINNELINSQLEQNPGLNSVMLGEKLGISDQAVRNHLMQMGRIYKLGKWLPHNLREQQKMLRMSTCLSLLQRFSRCDFLNCIVTGDEKWLQYDNRTRKHY